MTELPASAQKVVRALDQAGLEATVVRMPSSTRTAEDAADACRCTISQIVKSLVFQGKTTGSAVLVLVSGTNRVNEKAIEGEIGEALRRPNADYVREMTGFAIGGIPPLGHATPLKTWFDADLLKHDVVWASAGTPDCVFSADPARLAAATGASVIRVC